MNTMFVCCKGFNCSKHFLDISVDLVSKFPSRLSSVSRCSPARSADWRLVSLLCCRWSEVSRDTAENTDTSSSCNITVNSKARYSK